MIKLIGKKDNTFKVIVDGGKQLQPTFDTLAIRDHFENGKYFKINEGQFLELPQEKFKVKIMPSAFWGEVAKICWNYEPKDAWQHLKAYQPENRDWVRTKGNIVLNILETLDLKNMTQEELSKKVGITVDELKFLFRPENDFTLKQIDDFEKALGKQFIKVVEYE